MRWITAASGFVLVLIFSQATEALSSVPWRSKRSVDLNDIRHLKLQHRLPKEVVPTNYNLELEPFVGNEKFRGRVRINVTWTDTSDTVTLNVHPELKITKYAIRITEASFEEREKGLPLMDVNVARVSLPTSGKHWYSIHLEQMLKKGSSCEVEMSFIGNLTANRSNGLFKNEYMDQDGKKRFVIATYLRLDHAHSMFPCMDEPPYKATYKLSVLRPKNLVAHSNTPLESTTGVDGDENLVWDHFEKTPEMSTYQLALFVSDFESISPTLEMNEMDGRKLEIKLWGRKEYLEFLEPVPNKVVKIMNYLQEYFNNSIGLPKLDLIAVPSYSAAKVSDSWGLMFFQESELSSASTWNIAYELLYQWIGQYITPFRWADAPVNKALNSFFASMTTIDFNPDEMEGKWPMTMLYSLYYEFGKVEPFLRVGGIRNEATLAKTELIFRMLNYTIGKDLFREGVRNFIHQKSEESPRTYFQDDIYSRLNDAVNGTDILPEGLTINGIVGPWIHRDRVPLVTVTRDYESRTITLNQKVYLREPLRTLTPITHHQWDIPIIMMAQDKLEFHKPCPLWLSRDAVNYTIPDIADENKFIIVNPEEIGIFPVNYDSCNWKMLSEFLRGPNREKISILTRAKLLHDSWNLAYSGKLCFGIALNMTLFLKQERSHVVWEPVFMMIDHVGRRIEGTDVYPLFEAYIRTLLKPLYEELSESIDKNEPSWKTHMRRMATNFLCRAGYEPCVREARDQYKKWVTDEDPDKGNPVANEIICPVFKWGTEEEWEFGLQRVIHFPQDNPGRKQNERTYLLKSLAGCPKDAYKMERLLNVSILEQTEKFTDSDIQLLFTTLSSRAIGYTTLFNFIIDHWDIVKSRFEDKKHLWYRITEYATSSFGNQKSVETVRKLSESYPEFDNVPNFRSLSTFINEKKLWSAENLPVISAWLMKNLPEDELKAFQANIHSDITTTVGTTVNFNME